VIDNLGMQLARLVDILCLSIIDGLGKYPCRYYIAGILTYGSVIPLVGFLWGLAALLRKAAGYSMKNKIFNSKISSVCLLKTLHK